MNDTKRILKVGIVQQQNTETVSENLAALESGITALAADGATLIVLQELHNSLYFCQVENPDYFQLAESIPGQSTERFGALAKTLGVVIVTSLFEKRAPGVYHNTAVVLETDGSIAGTYRKMHIPDDPGYYEKFYFTPGDLGFTPIQTSVGKLGVLVCWDQWYPEAARLMAMAGAELLIYPTAIGFDPRDAEAEKERQLDAWLTVQRGHAVANGLPVITVNRTGTEADPSNATAGIQFWGHSFVAGAQGELLFTAPRCDSATQVVDIDMSRIETVRRIWPFFRDRRIDAFDGITRRLLDEEVPVK
ncbi:MAG: carbon-nitrogen hydrolase [Deltaproteobacteria bacterium]|nr:carbon-nitrogen hydrolase [Deltaproteobacteria bacterium]MBN2673013.1 carbon-nitrogen hydrolase [Deltaproteobacteria bacterium]